MVLRHLTHIRLWKDPTRRQAPHDITSQALVSWRNVSPLRRCIKSWPGLMHRLLHRGRETSGRRQGQDLVLEQRKCHRKRARKGTTPEPEMEKQGQTKGVREGELKLDCGICLQPLAGLLENGGPSGPCGGLLGGRARLENCPHIFCYGCIAKWADIKTTCPTCRQTFSRMYVIDNKDVTLRTIII